MTDFHKLYSRYADDIYNFALFLSGNSDDAKDITAETFARVLTGKTMMVSATVKGYMLTVARNLYLESVRRQKRYKALSQDLPDSNLYLENMIMFRTELEALMAYLQKFPELDRSALLMRAEGLTYFEITKTLNISIASAKVKVHRLRLKLAEWRASRESKTKEK